MPNDSCRQQLKPLPRFPRVLPLSAKRIKNLF